MTISANTGAVEARPCQRCGASVEHRESVAMSCGPERRWWSAEAHVAPCGQPCMGGGARGVKRDGIKAYHGWQDRCPVCGPLRVLPEVVAEMRERAAMATAGGRAAPRDPAYGEPGEWIVWFPDGTDSATLSEADATLFAIARSDILRACDEIDKLRAELAETQQAPDEAKEQATFARMELYELRHPEVCK